MPPRLFPLPLKVGTDICKVSRIKALISKDPNTHGGNAPSSRHITPLTQPLEQFLAKFMTWPERNLFWKRFGSRKDVLLQLDRVSEHLAGRWAAKEAIRKACKMGTSNGFHRIMIYKEDGQPRGLILDERLPSQATTIENWTQIEFNAQDFEGQICQVSISHDGDYATAVAAVAGELAVEGDASQNEPRNGPNDALMNAGGQHFLKAEQTDAMSDAHTGPKSRQTSTARDDKMRTRHGKVRTCFTPGCRRWWMHTTEECWRNAPERTVSQSIKSQPSQYPVREGSSGAPRIRARNVSKGNEHSTPGATPQDPENVGMTTKETAQARLANKDAQGSSELETSPSEPPPDNPPLKSPSMDGAHEASAGKSAATEKSWNAHRVSAFLKR